VRTDSRTWRAVYWAATAIATIAFVLPGVANLAHAAHITQDMAHLGYPPYFPTLLGAWKVLGAAVIVSPRFPRLKEWAYAGMIFDLTGAAFSRTATGDGIATVIFPLGIAAVVLASWRLRPEGRALHSAAIVTPL
jgi:DoxX-like family